MWRPIRMLNCVAVLPAVQRELGLCVSVGVAPNRLLAKLASAAAKPDGVRLVADRQAALQMLAQVSSELRAVRFHHLCTMQHSAEVACSQGARLFADARPQAAWLWRQGG